MSEFYGPAERADSLATLGRAVEIGVSFVDTSDAYGIGANETLLGEFLAGARRDEIRVATKFGAVRDPQTGRPVEMRSDPEYVRLACDASLKRLGVDRIDLFYLHFPDRRTPIEDTVGAIGELVAAGKVDHVGVSNVTAEQIRAGHRAHPIAAVQNEWSLFTRDAEDSVIPACAELGIGFVPYSPLGRGFLTGVYTSDEGLAPTDIRHAVPRFTGTNAVHNASLLEPVRAVARAHDATPAQVALAWLILKGAELGAGVVPIPGTRSADRIAENARAADLTLSPQEMELLEPIGAAVLGAPRPPVPAAARQTAE
ncbi:aldo/keto reductase [Actinoplanes sp. NPDC026619]|uniref:aldo/keto reductase n=1 Tax=Actinoplanes sp. NPDC026619 TaxID=3155798 RepID=UPI0033CCF5E3